MTSRQEILDKLKKFVFENGYVEEAEWKEKLEQISPLEKNNGDYPSYRVTIKLHPEKGSDIRVVVWLPEENDWNGKFLGTGNGGFAGEISIGALRNGLIRGYACANTDMGTSKEPDDCIGNMEVVKDFGYRATHLMTLVGKQLCGSLYGRIPEYSYFIGGSTGGQQAFSEAQRYPEDYDGIIALSPAFDRVRLHAFFIWNWQQIHSRQGATFTGRQAKQWNKAIVRTYRSRCLSSSEDPFLAYPGGVQCNPVNDPALEKEIKQLLTPGQRDALRQIYDGPKDPVTGEAFVAGFLPGTEAEMLSLETFSDRYMVDHDFFYLYRWVWGKDFDFMKFDFHRDLQRAEAMLGPYLDAADPALERFQDLGHKLLVIGGSADAIVPYTGFLDYYQQVIQRQGSLGKTKEFFRFFLMPGFSHTFGGPGVQDVGGAGLSATPRDPLHDAICAMEQWVEKQEAPNLLLGTHLKFGLKEIRFDYARPAFAYPYAAKFEGTDVNNPNHYIPIENKEIYEYGKLRSRA